MRYSNENFSQSAIATTFFAKNENPDFEWLSPTISDWNKIDSGRVMITIWNEIISFVHILVKNSVLNLVYHSVIPGPEPSQDWVYQDEVTPKHFFGRSLTNF